MSSHAAISIQDLEPKPISALAEASGWCGPETILLVEDEEFVRRATAEALESAGYRLLIAKSAAEALESCRNCLRPVDLLLTDVVMPGRSGPDLAAEFKSICPHARVLLMTGHVEQLAERWISRHGNRCLSKPFSIGALLKRVREALDNNAVDRATQA